MRYRRALGLLLVGLMWNGGCETEGIYEGELEMGDVHTLKNGITIHEEVRDRIYYLDGRLNDPLFKKLFTPEAGERIAWSAPGPSIDEPTQLFVMTTPIDARDSSLDERLFRVTVDGKKPTAYKVGTRFDSITFGLDGQFAILYHGAQDESEPGLYNANEVALIDLSKQPSATNPLRLNVSMDGRRIDMVSFVPSLMVGGVARKLAVFMAGSVVRVVDLDDPKETWVKVPLLPKSDNRDITPLQLIALDEEPDCGDASCEAKLFLRASNTQDVYYITLGRNADSFAGTQSKQLEAGGFPLDMELVHDGDVTFLLVLSQDGNLSKVNVIDIDTSEPFPLSIPTRLTTMEHLEDDTTDKVALYGTNASAVYFLTVEALGEEKGKNLDDLVIQGGIRELVELDQSRLLIIPNGDRGLVLLDLLSEKASNLSASDDYDWGRAQIHEDIFYVVPEMRDRVDYLDLSTGQPNFLMLDDYATSLHLVPGRQTGIALHATDSGRATLFPLANPTRGKAKVVDGFWLKDILSEEGVAQ